MKAFALLLISCFSLFAQSPLTTGSGIDWTPASSALTPCQLAIGTGFPTNITGYPAYTWWVGQCGYSTNGGVATLADFSANGIDLKMAALATAPNGAVNTVGGFSDVLFGLTAPRTLTNLNFTIPSGNQCEFWCVMSYTNISGKDWLFHDVSAANTGLAVVRDLLAASKIALYNAGTAADVLSPCTNKYMVFNFVFTQGASATIYTNDTAGITVNVGSGGLTSFRLSGGVNGNNGLQFSFLEGGWYRTNLTTVGRSNLFYYCTNKFKLSP